MPDQVGHDGDGVGVGNDGDGSANRTITQF